MPQMRMVADVITGAQIDPRSHHLQPARGQGAGVTRNTAPDADSLILMAGFFDDENQVRLVRRDGEVAHRWSLDYFAHFPDRTTRVCDLATPLHVDLHGVHLTPEGALLANYEYCGTVKLDACGSVLWRLDEPTHHSLVAAEAGGYWILGRDAWRASAHPDRLPPFSHAGGQQILLEDALLNVSETGEILDEISIPQLMVDGGLAALLTANGENFPLPEMQQFEIVHANQATELPAALAEAFPQFQPGDIAMSLREMNLVFVFDPETREIKWHQTGPWLRQHDAEFRPDGRISVFNNNVYRTAYPGDQTDLSVPFSTNILAIDPATGATEVLFGEAPGQEMLSVVRGQHQILNDGLLITEFDAGRVIEVDGSGQIVWEYVNAQGAAQVGEITNSAVIPADYLQSDWAACNQ